ncbi:MAG TPA: allantoate amidohydrolase [Usitatibacter sp.]|nr:allantoate amidohydrolase [Usitatibacter sp.]
MDTVPPAAGRELIERVQRLARHSESPHHYTRTYLTPSHRAAAEEIAGWMREAGMVVRVDAVGSVIGRYEAAVTGARTLLLGSHFDSVRNGGTFDGVLGILVPIACVAELHRRGERLSHAIEVAAFSDEEGARFQTSFLASRAMVDGGASLEGLLDRRDADGVTLGEALRSAGLDPAAADAQRVDPRSLAAYVEVHIEQGPVLLDEGRALGVVTSIAAGLRYRIVVKGEAGHAGTVPMARRHDALAAAAEMVVAIEKRCSGHGSLVGTVGTLRVKDGTANVIPGEVEFTVDIRAADGSAHVDAARDAFAECEVIARRRGVAFETTKTHEVQAAPCAGWLQDRIAASIERTIPGAPARRLPSGAGHDAMILARACDVGMMFVRCGAGGVSHNPAETVSAADAGLAFSALLDFLRAFGR